ncbi:class I SAM-dependent methyltransferase [Deltaproteobacteria bacterium]|nr:class I SAM-dependent methyltransferase [Deltaproteobacteria bacterium]
MRILVAIANFGTGNRQYVERLLREYRAMPADISIVVCSNIPKDLGPDIEVRVGLPTRNPRSLPFAPRNVFLERKDDFDLFIYSEDDTLVTWEAIDAFVSDAAQLEGSEIPGFLRQEVDESGNRYFSSSHAYFRWLPSSVKQRGNDLWAAFSNEHSACFMVTREQLARALRSGGLGTTPHEGRYAMLESAATDIYTQCGLERVINLNKLPAYTLHHLPNKYVGKMGLPEHEMEWQIEALRKQFLRQGDSAVLFELETKLPRGRGSKCFREDPDSSIEGQLADTERVLVYGAGDGAFEAGLAADEREIFCIPIDSVAEYCCRKRGLEIVGVEEGGPLYDAIVLRDVLHLVDNPVDLLARLRGLLRPGGRMVCRIPNLHSRRVLVHRFIKRRLPLLWTKARIGCEAYGLRQLQGLLKESGFELRSAGYASPTAEPDSSYRADLASRFKFSFIYASADAVDGHAS